MKKNIFSIADKFSPEVRKQRPLSQSMILALVVASAKQKEGRSFGPSDVKRSFIPLIKRGLIVRSEPGLQDKRISWQITPEAINMLKAIGIENAH